MHEADGKVLLMDVTNNSHVFPKSECKLVDLNKDIKVGDIIEFEPNYSAQLYLTLAPDVNIVFK